MEDVPRVIGSHLLLPLIDRNEGPMMGKEGVPSGTIASAVGASENLYSPPRLEIKETQLPPPTVLDG